MFPYAELAPHYSAIGRPSIDPVLMLRMLVLGYMFVPRVTCEKGIVGSSVASPGEDQVRATPFFATLETIRILREAQTAAARSDALN